MVYLLETRVSPDRAREIAPTLGFSRYEIAPSEGMSGGIWMLWNEEEVDVQIVLREDQGIHAVIGPRRQNRWLLSGVYSKPNKVDKLRCFDNLLNISQASELPWLVMGDFNEIGYSHEKRGGNTVTLSRLTNFQQNLEACGLADLGFKGPAFTWTDNREGSAKIRERIDRALANAAWIEQYPNNVVLHLPRTHSDHHPILTNCNGLDESIDNKPFRFEAIWYSHPDCESVLKNVWNAHGNILAAIEAIPEVMGTWNREQFGNLFRKKKKILARLEGIQKALSNRDSDHLNHLEKVLLKDYNEILRQEELFWFQKSRVNWMKEGDGNTKFFHHSTLARRKRNKIIALKVEGEWIHDDVLLRDHAKQFFESIFSVPEGEAPSGSLPLSRFQSKLNAADGARLVEILELPELKKLVWETNALKTPGPDGLQALFYQRGWEWVKDSLLNFMQQAFLDGYFDSKVCGAYLCLIPKVQNPTLISQYRPISLCNVLYKLVTKCITMRLKNMMPDLISPTQSSFIRGRSTQDNILVLQELLHSLRAKKKNKTGSMILKLDLEKAYDKVDWHFLEDTLKSIEFPPSLIKLIMFCVRSASTRILWNGEPLEAFRHGCGLRQGDPLSPYLFVLCVERLSYLIQEAVEGNKWCPIIPCKNGPALSHLFFADDLVLMGKANISTAKTIRKVMDDFCHASGLKISPPKSKVFFSNSGSTSLQREISATLGFGITKDLGRYLGVQLQHGRVTRQTFAPTMDKILGRLNGWKSKFLNLAGRTTLIKSVSSAIPIYSMQESWLPEHICDEFNKLNRNFLWSTDYSSRKIHLVGWERVTQSKDQGGLGIRDARLTNMSLLAKIAWKILKKEDTVWYAFVQAKYLKGQSLMQYLPKPGDSQTWKGVLKCADMMKPFLTWKIGDGESISFWFDIWFDNTPLSDKIPSDIVDKITDQEVRYTGQPDVLIWNANANGIFSCQSAYKKFKNMQDEDNTHTVPWKWIWKTHLSNKLKHFLWLLVQERLATNSLRRNRQMTYSATCLQCQSQEETGFHIVRHCDKAREIWDELMPAQFQQDFYTNSDQSWLQQNLLEENGECQLLLGTPWQIIFAAALWVLWTSRNHLTFNGKEQPKQLKLYQIKQTAVDLQAATNAKLSKGGFHTWKKPKSGWNKLNVDGSIPPEQVLAGVGGLIRDSNGKWIWGFSKSIPTASTDEVELEALKTGLTEAWKRRMPKLEVEMDSMNVVGMVTGNAIVPAHLQAATQACRELLRQPWETRFRWVPRAENGAADLLSRLQLTDDNRQGTVPVGEMEEAPICLFSILTFEKA